MKLFSTEDGNDGVRLVVPTDFEILEVLAGGQRENPKNLGTLLSKENNYMAKRLRALEGHGLVEEIHDSTMFVITAKGRAALHLRSQYDHSRTQEFAREVEEELARREASDCGSEEDQDADVEV